MSNAERKTFDKVIKKIQIESTGKMIRVCLSDDDTYTYTAYHSIKCNEKAKHNTKNRHALELFTFIFVNLSSQLDENAGFSFTIVLIRYKAMRFEREQNTYTESDQPTD